MVQSDRRSVSFPMWRKKVDRTILNDNGCTVLPAWIVENFGIKDKFGKGKNNPDNQILIHFQSRRYEGGSITVQTESRATPFYRLWLPLPLVEELRISFQMTYIRGLEEELQKKASGTIKSNFNSESEIPFWEFLDIEFDAEKMEIHLTAHWKQEVMFPMFFREIINSQLATRIEQEVLKEKELVIAKSDWKPKSHLQSQLNEKNVIYWLVDKINKQLYVGMAENLTKRVTENRPEIPNWTHYRYDVLPYAFDDKIRHAIEKMVIRAMASLLKNQPVNGKSIDSIELSEYTLVNKQISPK
jgi:hypothetical protein